MTLIWNSATLPAAQEAGGALTWPEAALGIAVIAGFCFFMWLVLR